MLAESDSTYVPGVTLGAKVTFRGEDVGIP